MEYAKVSDNNKKKISEAITHSAGIYIIIAFGAYVYNGLSGNFPLSKIFPYNWTYHALLSWGVFFLIIYKHTAKKTGKHLYAVNFAFQSVLAAGWLHELFYYHSLEMFISPNAVFGVNSQIISLGIIFYEFKGITPRITKRVMAAILVYVGFSLIITRDVNMFRRIVWIYRIPAGLIFLALSDSLTTKSKHKDRIKILHIWNTAGVAGYIAQAMDHYEGTRSKVLMRSAHDTYGCTIKGKNYDDRAAVFILRALAHSPFYDIIHVHGLEKIIPLIKLAIPWKPLFLHYHGTNIRGLWEEKRKYWRWADEIFVSTPDLLTGAPDKAIWIPNPVNEILCLTTRYHARPDEFRHGVAFSDSRWAVEEAAELAAHHSLEIEWGHRTLTEGLNHAEYLEYIVDYPVYVDVKRDFPGYGDGSIIEAHSLTALEMLAMGRHVIRWDEELIEDFPAEHNGRAVARKLFEVYGRYRA